MKKAIVLCSLLLIGSYCSADDKASANVKTVAPATKITTTASGLRYIDQQTGTGAEAVSGKTVDVHYTGWLNDGHDQPAAKFDSSHDRNQAFSFALGAGMVIKGWDEGVAGMKIGGKRRLLIPSQLGYGTNGAPPAIPANANLIFDVELLAVR